MEIEGSVISHPGFHIFSTFSSYLLQGCFLLYNTRTEKLNRLFCPLTISGEHHEY